MIRTGITGIIGSGKSTVAKVFEVMGIPVFNADQAAKALYADPEVSAEVVNAFGKEITDNRGKIDFQKLAGRVFSDRESNLMINRIIHPRVKAMIGQWLAIHKDCQMTIYESALLFESGFHEMLDYTITVSAPVDLCIQRVMQRNMLTREEILKRMSFQLSNQEKSNLSDHIILNDETRLIIPQILQIKNLLLKTQGS